MAVTWRCGGKTVDFKDGPWVMGIINATPDSFSDGGDYGMSLKDSLDRAERMVKDGAKIIDVGGESSRPNSRGVDPEEEFRRIEGILRELKTWDIPVSVDTRRTPVMERVLGEGLCDCVNDIEALTAQGAVETLARYPDAGICLMHMKGQPENMQKAPSYVDVAQEVYGFLRARVEACESAGIERERLMLDPGIGFGKNKDHNIALLRATDGRAREENLPILIGASRKTVIGDVDGEPVPKRRLGGSIAIALDAAARGASVIRVHDVKETTQAIKMLFALRPELLERYR